MTKNLSQNSSDTLGLFILRNGGSLKFKNSCFFTIPQITRNKTLLNLVN